MPAISGKTGSAGADGTHAVGAPPIAREEAVPWRRLTLIGLLGAVLGYWVKVPCRFGGAWMDGSQYQKLCYSDIVPLYYRDDLDAGTIPYIDKPVEYPVLTGGLMHILAKAVSWLPSQLTRSYGYFDATAAVLGLCLVAIVLSVGWLAGRGGLDAAPDRPFNTGTALLAGAFTALVPAALWTLYINWDLLAVALAVGGIAAYARRRLWLAGALIGLAVAAKFYPFLFFGPLFVLMIRDLRAGEGRAAVTSFTRPLVGALLAWGAVNLPVYLVSPQGWAEFFKFSSERGADWGSVYYVLGQFGLFPHSDLDMVNRFGTGTLLLACVGIGLLALFAPNRPRAEQLFFLVVAAFLITNKVWSPQFVLWLLPLAVLAWPRGRGLSRFAVVLFGLWQLAELSYVVGIWKYLEFATNPESAAGIDVQTYALLVFGRLFSLLMVCVLIVVDCLVNGSSRA